MQAFSVEIVPLDSQDAMVLKPKGSIDSASTPVLEGHFDKAMVKDRYRIVVDLSETDFISSCGFGLFLGTVATLREHGGDLILMKIPDHIADIFDTLNIADYFQTISSLEDLKTTSS